LAGSPPKIKFKKIEDGLRKSTWSPPESIRSPTGICGGV